MMFAYRKKHLTCRLNLKDGKTTRREHRNPPKDHMRISGVLLWTFYIHWESRISKQEV